MRVAAEFAHALSRLDWSRAEALVAADVVVNITGGWIYGGAAVGLRTLRHAAEAGAADRPPLQLAGTVRQIVEQGDRAAVEMSGKPDYAMILTMRDGKVTRLGFYFDTLYYVSSATS